MAKYIDKSALVAEIERRRNDYINSFMTEQVYMLNNVLDFLDTLEVKEMKEEPISNNMEYASEKYACRFSSSKYGHDKVKDAFIAGAQWQKEHLWKPSDKQMKAIRIAAEIGTANDSWAMGILRDMYNDLNKLKEK